MRKLLLASLCLAGLAADAGFAEEPIAAPGSAKSKNSENQDPAIEHLLKAAEHLESAGLHDDAAKLRHDAKQRAVHENILSRKESELECLQEEVDRLRALLGQTTGIQIDITAVEVDRRKLGLKAAEFDKLIGLVQASPGAREQTPDGPGIVEANPTRLPLFRDLCERGIVKVLAEPTLTTTSGRPANFSDGGEVVVHVKSPNGDVSLRNVRFGTNLEVVPEMRPNQRIRLQTCFELHELKSNVIDDDGTAHPEIRSRRLNTEVEMQPGQTLTLGRLITPRSKGPGITGPGITGPGITGPGITGPGITGPGITGPGITGPGTKGAVARGDAGERKANAQPVTELSNRSESIETIVFVTPRLIHAGIMPRPTGAVPAENELQEDDTLQPIVPAAFDPTDASEFGPAIPILKRRPVKD